MSPAWIPDAHERYKNAEDFTVEEVCIVFLLKPLQHYALSIDRVLTTYYV